MPALDVDPTRIALALLAESLIAGLKPDVHAAHLRDVHGIDPTLDRRARIRAHIEAHGGVLHDDAGRHVTWPVPQQPPIEPILAKMGRVGRPSVTLHTSDPTGPDGAPVGELHPGGRIGRITWASGNPRQVVGIARVWDAAHGGQVVCSAPILDGTTLVLCGKCEPCRARTARP